MRQISILRPRYHGTQVSARTFLTIMKTFVMHIVKFTWTVDDRGDHIMAGYAVLRTGVYKALNSQAVQREFTIVFMSAMSSHPFW